MDSALVQQFIPMVAIVMTIGLPIGIVFITKYFAFRHRELDAELEARKMLSNRDRVELEKRIERLESVVMGARVQAAELYAPPPSLPNEPIAGAVKPREQL
jgi:hypothetical protein